MKSGIYLLWLLVVTLAGCAGSPTLPPNTASTNPGLPQPALPPPSPDPTATPAPLVEFSAVQTITHSSGLFSVQKPGQWNAFEQPDGTIIIEPGKQAGYTIVFDNVGETLDRDALEKFLFNFVATNFGGDQTNLQPISLEKRTDGSVVARFSTTDVGLGPMVSQVKIFQVDRIIYLVYTSATEAVWNSSQAELLALSDTLQPLDAVAAGLPTPTAAPPEWTLIGPDSKTFGFLMASDWDIVRLEDNLVSVSSPKSGMTFTASSFDWPNIDSPQQAALEAATAHLLQVTDTYTEVQQLPPTEFPLDTATGATIDYIYTATDGQLMAGSVITGVGNGRMHQIVFTAPADFYDAALEWFNTMYKSYKFLSPEEGLPSEE